MEKIDTDYKRRNRRKKLGLTFQTVQPRLCFFNRSMKCKVLQRTGSDGSICDALLTGKYSDSIAPVPHAAETSCFQQASKTHRR